MPDLRDQISRYIDEIAEPVTAAEAVRSPRKRWPQHFIAAAAVVVIGVVSAAVTVVVVRNKDSNSTIEAKTGVSSARVPIDRGPVDGRWVISVGQQRTPPKVDAPPPTTAEQVPPGAETAALVEALLRTLPDGWALAGTSELKPSDGSTVRGAAFDAPDGIGRLSADWQDLVQPMAVLPDGDLSAFGSYEQTPEGEFLTINHAAPEAEVTLVRPNGHRLSLRYGPRYTQEHTREQIEASGGPPSALDAGALRSIATRNLPEDFTPSDATDPPPLEESTTLAASIAVVDRGNGKLIAASVQDVPPGSAFFVLFINDRQTARVTALPGATFGVPGRVERYGDHVQAQVVSESAGGVVLAHSAKVQLSLADA